MIHAVQTLDLDGRVKRENRYRGEHFETGRNLGSAGNQAVDDHVSLDRGHEDILLNQGPLRRAHTMVNVIARLGFKRKDRIPFLRGS